MIDHFGTSRFERVAWSSKVYVEMRRRIEGIFQAVGPLQARGEPAQEPELPDNDVDQLFPSFLFTHPRTSPAAR